MKKFRRKFLYGLGQLITMVKIKVYEITEEAKQQLERYELDNQEAFDSFVKRQGESASERLGEQTYFFVVELAAYVDDGPDKFYF